MRDRRATGDVLKLLGEGGLKILTKLMFQQFAAFSFRVGCKAAGFSEISVLSQYRMPYPKLYFLDLPSHNLYV